MEGQEDPILDAAQVNILYEGETIVLPKKLLEVNLADIVNLNTISNEFTQEEINDLLQYLPKQDMESLRYALEGKGIYESHL